MDVEKNKPYSPKLKFAMEEIKDILAKHDVGGVVVLHDPPNKGEFALQIEPSYSCAKIVGDLDGIHFRAKAKDFKGGAKEQKQKIKDTVNMFETLFVLTGRMCMTLDAAMKKLGHKFDIDRSSGDTFTKHDPNWYKKK